MQHSQLIYFQYIYIYLLLLHFQTVIYCSVLHFEKLHYVIFVNFLFFSTFFFICCVLFYILQPRHVLLINEMQLTLMVCVCVWLFDNYHCMTLFLTVFAKMARNECKKRDDFI